MVEKKWLVFYTKPRAEKKVQEYLVKFGFEPYLPLQTVIKQWSDRKKKVEVPLFNSYIFVYDLESSIADILKVPGMAWNIRHNGKPAVLRQEHLEMIQRFLETGLLVETNDAEFLKKGDRVEVMGGPLRGMIGVLTREFNEDKFSVLVETLDQVLTVNINKEMLKFLSRTDDDNEDSYWKNL